MITRLRSATSDDDFASKFINSGFRAMLSALVFSVLAMGLAEKYRELYRFRPVGQYVLGRDLLDAALDQLKGDPCWRAYSSAVADAERVSATRIADMEGISCNYEQPMQVQVDGKDLIPAHEHSPLPAAPARRPAPADAKTPSSKGTGASSAPAAPTMLTITVFYPLATTETFKNAIAILWDDKTLNLARTYSNAVGQEIWRWQVRRTTVSQMRGTSSGAGNVNSGPPNMVALATDQLTIADLEYLNTLPRETVASFDRIVNESFRPTLPNSSFGVTLSTATSAVAIAIAMFMAWCAANLKAARIHNQSTRRNSVIHAFIGSLAYEFVALVTLTIPAFASASLVWDVQRTLPETESRLAFVPLFVSAGVTAVATLAIIRMLSRVMTIAAPLHWSANWLRRRSYSASRLLQ